MSEVRKVAVRLALGFCLLAAGCFSLSKAYPEKRQFALDAPVRGETTSPPLKGVLRVNILRVGPLYEGNELVYRTGDVEYESDFYNQWFVPPGPMLSSAFTEWLRDAGVFEHVVTAAAGVDATFMLGGVVTALHGDYRTEPPRAVLAVETYVANEDAAPEILCHHSYRKEVQLTKRSAEALARGLSEALRLILVDLEGDLRRLQLK